LSHLSLAHYLRKAPLNHNDIVRAEDALGFHPQIDHPTIAKGAPSIEADFAPSPIEEGDGV
jgi:hypothetical protein